MSSSNTNTPSGTAHPGGRWDAAVNLQWLIPRCPPQGWSHSFPGLKLRGKRAVWSVWMTAVGAITPGTLSAGCSLPALPESTLARVGRERGGAPTHRGPEQELEAEDSLGARHTGGGLAKLPRVPGTPGALEVLHTGGPSLVVTPLLWGLRAPAWGHVISGDRQTQGAHVFLLPRPGLDRAALGPGLPPPLPPPRGGPWALWCSTCSCWPGPRGPLLRGRISP